MHTVFVGGLREWHRTEHLLAMLEEEIDFDPRIEVPVDAFGRGQLIAFITCPSRTAAEAVIATLHDREVAGGWLVAHHNRPKNMR